MNVSTAKTDCFGYKVRECMALTTMLCKNGGECPFYKTKEQYNSDRIKYEKIAAARKGGVNHDMSRMWWEV